MLHISLFAFQLKHHKCNQGLNGNKSLGGSFSSKQLPNVSVFLRNC